MFKLQLRSLILAIQSLNRLKSLSELAIRFIDQLIDREHTLQDYRCMTGFCGTGMANGSSLANTLHILAETDGLVGNFIFQTKITLSEVVIFPSR